MCPSPVSYTVKLRGKLVTGAVGRIIDGGVRTLGLVAGRTSAKSHVASRLFFM